MAQKAFNLRKQIGDPRGLLSALIELGSVYSQLHSSIDADRCFRQADSIAIKIEDYISLAEIRIGWAEFLLNHGEINRADTLARQAYAMVNQNNNVRLLPRVTLLMGKAQFELKSFAASKRHLENVVKLTEQSHPEFQRDAYLFLSKIYDQEGRKTEATLLSNKYLILKESLQRGRVGQANESLNSNWK